MYVYKDLCLEMSGLTFFVLLIFSGRSIQPFDGASITRIYVLPCCQMPTHFYLQASWISPWETGKIVCTFVFT